MTAQRLALAADHGGLQLKAELTYWLQAQEYQVLDLGASSLDPATAP